MNIEQSIAQKLSLKENQIQSCIELLNEGATLPFIARYRKEKTGSLTETEIAKIIEEKNYFDDLSKRKETILAEIESQGKLTNSLKWEIEKCYHKQDLEDLYLPYKPKRATRASKAIDAGLLPVVTFIKEYSGRDSNSWKNEVKKLNQNKLKDAGFESDEQILGGVSDILATEIAEKSENRALLREEYRKNSSLEAKAKKEWKEKPSRFSDYYSFSSPLSRLKSHTILALLRGEREKVLSLKFSYDAEWFIGQIGRSISDVRNSCYRSLFTTIAEDAYKRLLAPSIETDIRNELIEQADSEAIAIFDSNLETVLMAPPAGAKPTLAIDPGFRTGCKVAVLSETGKFLEHTTIYPTEPIKKIDAARENLLKLIGKYQIELIGVGNGTGGRETESFLKNEVVPRCPKAPLVVTVNESGASIYSASERAIKEFPHLDITIRGAISIGRRLQDPLAELVKIDPKSIGVGQYQHDVNQTTLKESLNIRVERCVNRVGADLNLASEALLMHISGITATTAKNIIAYRDEKGSFTSRKELLKVKGIGPKAYEQCAGFLRIFNGTNPLDASAVHPESYPLVKEICGSLRVKERELIGNEALLSQVKISDFVAEEHGAVTIKDIIEELKKPGRDPRKAFEYASFSDNINDISDLTEGMKLEGVVTNVTAFGAFVDIGVHQDGLVHISQLANHFVSNPADVVSTGQVVKVTVVEVDSQRKRISLSMK